MSNVSWINAVGGDWDIASNWSSSPSIPGAADDVLISLANGPNHDITHSSGAADTINSLTVTGNNLFSLSAGSITVSGAASLAAQVYLSGGALVFNGASSASQFSHSNGTLGGTGVLTVTGSALFLNQNVETGSGTTDLKGATTVGVAGWGNSYYTLGLDGGRVFKNQGALSWVGGIIQTGGYGGTAGNSTIDNAVGGVFDVQFDGQIRVLNGTNVITNEGTFKKSAGGGAASIAPAFNNTGVVEGDSGVLSLQGGGTSSGSFVVGAGGDVQFAGGVYTITGGGSSGAGVVEVAAGALLVNGAFANASGFDHTNGTLGGTGVLTVTGSALFLNQNVETGSGTTDLKGATTVGVAGWGNSYYTLGLDGGRVFKNQGALSWVGGIIQTGGYGGTAGNSTIDNAVGGVFDVQFDGQIRVLNGTNVITNEGTFKKSAGGGAASIAPAFNNTGTVDVESGALVFGGPVTQYAVGSTTLTGGKWVAGPTASLQFAQSGLVGILTNNADVTLRGVGSDFGLINGLTTNNGALRILGGRSFTTAGAFTNAGMLQLGGGVFDGASLTNAAAGSVLGFGSLNQAVANAGTIEANGGALVLAGAISGSGALKIDAGAKLEVAGSIASSETTLFNGAGSILQLDQANSFASTISGFGFGNLIDLHGVNATSATLAGSTLTVTKSDLSTFTLTLSGSYTGRAFAVQGDGAGGSWISVSGVTTTGIDSLIGGAADDLVVATNKTLSIHASAPAC